MAEADKGARYACKVQPGVVVRRLWRGVKQRFEYVSLHESKSNPLPGQAERISDLVLRLANSAVPPQQALTILEFQSKPAEDKLDSTLIGVAHLNDKARHGPDGKGRFLIFVGIVHLTGKPAATEIDFALTDEKEVEILAGTHHRVLNWNVWEDDAAEALAEVEADFDNNWGLLFWIACMRNAAKPKNRVRWLKLVKRVPSKRDQGDIATITDVMAELAGTRPDWIPTLKEIDMSESQVVREWTAEAVEKGQIQILQDNLLQLARMKFKGRLKDEEIQMISSQQDIDVLREWHVALVQKSKYADFRNVLRQ